LSKQPASLLIRIDPGAREALEEQVYAGIRGVILEGALAPGTRLPSSRALALDLGVSRTTTVLALEQLLAEGYVATATAPGRSWPTSSPTISCRRGQPVPPRPHGIRLCQLLTPPSNG
jgi:GntR family transcriptional regulator / MocR family aminotransferase